jgi:hypothetical protein
MEEIKSLTDKINTLTDSVSKLSQSVRRLTEALRKSDDMNKPIRCDVTSLSDDKRKLIQVVTDVSCEDGELVCTTTGVREIEPLDGYRRYESVPIKFKVELLDTNDENS